MGPEQGTYAWVAGPTYETPAEGMLRTVGANVVGMRLVLEVLTAHECVAVLSLVTNTVVAPAAMRSMFDVVDAEVRASAGCARCSWVSGLLY